MFALAVTDPRWHDQMLSDPPTGLVNFWTPTPWKVKLQSGSRWGFMLKSPIRRIGGFGTLVGYEEATIEEAWERWGLANGVQSLADFRDRIIRFASRRSSAPIVGNNPTIGCVLLEACVFLPAKEWREPEEFGLIFKKQIVKWKRCNGELRLPFEDELPNSSLTFELVDPDGADWELKRTKKRMSQALFRRDVLQAYDSKCAMTGTACEQVLEAAHIQPFVNLKSNHIQNGIALRRDVHCLFDAGLLTIRPDYTIEVSSHLNGSPYRELHDEQLRLPSSGRSAPSQEAISFHRSEVFRNLAS